MQFAAAAAVVLETGGRENPFPPQAFGPDLEPVVDLARPNFQLDRLSAAPVLSQHLPPCWVGLCVQCVHL